MTIAPVSFETIDQLRGLLGRVDPSEARSEGMRLVHGVDRMIETDVLLRRYLMHLNQPSGARNTEPWTALGEQRYAAWLLANAALGRIDVTDTPGDRAALCAAWTVAAVAATPYLWSHEMDHLARNAPIPRHTISRHALPLPYTFWSFETNFAGTDGEINWNLIIDTLDGILIIADLARAGKVRIAAAYVPYGLVFPDDFQHVPAGQREAIEVLLQRLAFVSSPHVETFRERLPRPIRREMARAQQDPKPEHEPYVHVVRLRRTVVQERMRGQVQAPSEGWQHHWWVSGHYRAQWLPSQQAHRVQWIAPYVKGPLDKPLLEKVYVVDR